MADVVFLLGAGASQEAGAPLMPDFLDVARNIWSLYPDLQEDQRFTTVWKAIGDLQRVHSKARLDIHNVESVFASFEMAAILGRFGDYDPEEINELLPAMRRVIVATLERTILFPVVENRPGFPPPHEHFVALADYLERKAAPPRRVALLTFNYDMVPDFALTTVGKQFHYGLGDPKESPGVPLLKLHGSLNWASCRECNQVFAWPLRDYLRQRHSVILATDTYFRLEIGSQIGRRKCPRCGVPANEEPVLVPPTWNKSEQHQVLRAVWSRAAEELSEAEDFFVIGYSLPPSDAFFRYLYALGTVGGSLLRRFWVFNPDLSGGVEGRFKELVGPGAEQRFRYIPKTFSEAISELKRVYGCA